MIDRRSIGDKTLREIKAGCPGNCVTCDWLGVKLCKELFNLTQPRFWDIPQLTDAEIENIKLIRRLMPNSKFIHSHKASEMVWLEDQERYIRLSDNEFPSLQPGDTIKIDEVLKNA